MKMLKSQNLTYETDQKVQNAVVSSCKKTSECPDCLFLLVQHANALKPAQLARECALCVEHIGKQKLHACGLVLELAFCKNLWFLIR